MGLHRQEVMQRRAAILERISGQREQMAEVGVSLQPLFLVADRALLAVRFLGAHPVLVAGLAVLVVVRRRGLSGLVRVSWRVWKAYRYVNEYSQKLTSRS